MPLEFTHKVKTQSGYMTVANAELTALDVVAEPKALKQTAPVVDGMPMDGRWKVIENYKIEIDEI